MEKSSQGEESPDQSLSANEQFAQWRKEHSSLQQQIEKIEGRPFVTQADELEEQRLKKLKLHLKDQMNGMVSSQPTT